MIFYAFIWIIAGIALASCTFNTLWIFVLQGCIVIVGIFFLLIKNYCRIGRIKNLKVYQIFSIICLLLFGINYFQIRYHWLTEWQLPSSLIKKPLTIEGVVTEIPNQGEHGAQFFMKCQGATNQLIRLSWYDPHPAVDVGDHWQLTVSLKPSWGLHNFNAFDYQSWLIFRGVSATGTVLPSYPFTLLKRGRQYSISHWREQLLLLIQRSIKDPSIVGLITALTVGSHALIESRQWLVFQRTGTNHLMAISGLHIGMVAGFGFLLMGLLRYFFSRLFLYVPLQSLQALAAILVAFFYGLMSGFSLPTQRAVIMVFILMWGLLLRRPLFLWHRFIFAFCLVILVNPFSFFSISLWMSFGSVFWIAYMTAARFKPYKKLIQWWRLQLSLFVGLVPLTLMAFNQISFVGIAANFIAVPWVGFVILPVCLLGALSSFLYAPCAIFLFHLSGLLMKPLWQYLLFLSNQSWAIWTHVIGEPWIIVLGMLGAFLLLLPQGIPGRYMGLYLWLPLFFYKPAMPLKHELWLTVLDVGQGLSLFIQTKSHTLLYDAGPKSYFGFDAGESVVVPYLQYRGVSYLDIMMISHGDNDHIGGSYSVLRHMFVQKIITSVPDRFPKAALPCYRGQHWTWDGANFDVLWPLKNAPYGDNNSSCVLRITEGSMHLLLTGDIEKPAEQWLVKNDSGALAADILVAPHHGSISSSTESFLAIIKPKWVVVSSGFYNRYHFPSKIVLDRYNRLGATVYNTAINGAVFFKVNNKMIKTVKFATMPGR